MLHETTARVLDTWHRVRRFYFKGVLQQRVAQAQQEHRDMLAAMRSRDFGALAGVVRRHSQGALAAYLDFLDRGVGYAAKSAQKKSRRDGAPIPASCSIGCRGERWNA